MKTKLSISSTLLFVFIFLVLNILLFVNMKNNKTNVPINPKPTPIISPTPSPTPRPLTFAQLNDLYGPCVHLPVLFYHHIQNMTVAKAANQQNLTVDTNSFITQMQYLKDHNYISVNTNTITDFFDKEVPVPGKTVILTFDDGYEDFYMNVLPILRQDGFRAVMALPTGLVGNPGYLTWDEIREAASNGVEIVNHTWSHANLATNNIALIEKEVMTADTQLTQRGYNQNKAFVYPYGGDNATTINFLQSHGYSIAFTTVPGSTLCKKQRYTLPRMRIGNTSLSTYGF